MATTTVNYSDFLRKPTSVLPALGDGDVILERRGDEEDLSLTRRASRQAELDALRFAARSLRVLSRANRALAEEAFAEELPWLAWLPAEERPQAIAELLDDLLAGADTGRFTPFAANLVAWKHTAEVHTDPALARHLAGPFEATEFTEVERPGA
jgi:hypothetical protein